MDSLVETAAGPSQRARLLLLDDDRLILATLRRGLERVGYQVAVAASGPEALELAGQERFDLAILDVRMPGMSGIEVSRELRDTGGPPFLFLSAYGDASIVRQATDNGALGYLLKPVDVPQMLPTIETARGRALELARLRDSEIRLHVAMQVEQKTRTAVGVLMERYRTDRQTAFEALRRNARSTRRRILECAEEVLTSVEQGSQFDPATVLPPKRQRSQN